MFLRLWQSLKQSVENLARQHIQYICDVFYSSSRLDSGEIFFLCSSDVNTRWLNYSTVAKCPSFMVFYYSTLTFPQLKLWLWIFYPNQCFIEGEMIPSTVYGSASRWRGGGRAAGTYPVDPQSYDIILSHPFPAISSSFSADGSRCGRKCFVSLSPAEASRSFLGQMSILLLSLSPVPR